MKIYVDADACPVVKIVEQLAEQYEIPCVLLCDTNHVMSSDYSEVKIIGAGADAVDFALISLLKKDAGDIVCQTAHCGRYIPHFDFGEKLSPIVPYRHLPQILSGMTADCRSLV